MKKYQVIMTKSFFVKAKDEEDAEAQAIASCASDPETLMPHNMITEIESAEDAPDSYFND